MRWKERGRAAGLHLLASMGVALLAAVLVFQVWYPYPYGDLAGGNNLFRLLVSVDVVMGPLLTFVVYNRAKPRPELWRDLGVIVVLQLAALGYGLHTVYQARPVYLVHEVDRYRVVTVADVDLADLPQAQESFRQLPRFGVRVVGVRPARDADENLRSLELALAGKDLSLQPQRWQELDEANRAEIRRRARDLSFLRSRAKDGAQALDQLVATSGVPPEQIIGLPMMGRRDDWSVIMDRRDLRILGYLPIDAF
jgi:hypothetical protein